jgi:hypothetical protein
MNINAFTPQERFLMIQALNHMIVENYSQRLLFEKKKNFNKYVKPLNSALKKLTKEDEKLIKYERGILRGCLNGMENEVSSEEWAILIDCRKRLKNK